MKKKGLSDTELSTILEQAISDAERVTDGTLAKEREEVEKYYRGELPKPLHKGDSKYVSRDVFDTVDTARSYIVETFSGHNRIVQFQPERGETVDDAKQATEYTRHVFFKENDGESILYDAATEGLTKRFAVTKVYPDIDVEEEEFEFDNLTAEELTLAVGEHDNYEFTETDISENGLYSGTFTVTKTNKRLVVELVQPEDFGISSREASIEKADYCWHRVEKTKSELLDDGYDEKLVNKITFGEKDFGYDTAKDERFSAVDMNYPHNDAYDEASEKVILYEIYIRLDMDGRNKRRLWKICYAGDIILVKEQITRPPFEAFVPLPIAHAFHGENYAKGVIPMQNARTVLIRQIMNHSLITNNPRYEVMNGTVQNPSELLENRLGGIVNVRRQGGIMPLPQNPLNPYVFNLIQMINEDKEEVTGISKLSQGLNKDAISTQNAEGMIDQMISASQQRTKTVVRQFSSFIRRLFGLIYQTAVDHIDEAGFTDALGEYVEVNPTEWKNRSAASIELTLGYQEEEKEAAKWVEIDQYFSQDPQLSVAYTPDKRYEVLTRGLEKRGIEDISSILTRPEEIEPPEPSERDVLELEQIKSQIEYQNAQAFAMKAKAETDKMKAQADLLKARADAQYKAEEAAVDEAGFHHKVYMDREELKMAKAAPNKTATLNPNE